MKWLVVLLLACGTASAATLQEKVMLESGKYLNVRELNNNNRGKEIDKWNKYLGLPMGSPYCAAFVVSMYKDAGYRLPRIGRCYTLYNVLLADEIKYKNITPEELMLKTESLQAGDIIIWRHGKGTAQNWNGHAGIGRGKFFKTREANTMPSSKGNQREGGGVYDRERGLGIGTNFSVVGVIRVRKH